MAFKQSCDVTLGFVLSCQSLSSPVLLATLSSALIISFPTYESQLSRGSSSLVHYMNLDQDILWAVSHGRIYNLSQVPL